MVVYKGYYITFVTLAADQYSYTVYNTQHWKAY